MKDTHKRKRLAPGAVISLGFLTVILTGAVLLALPIAHSGRVPVTLLDALFTSTSAVCVTGLITVDTGVAYSFFGQVVVAMLLQIGGLGITSLGAGLIALLGGQLNQRENNLVKEALNYPTWDGIMPLIRAVILLDFTIEAIGAFLSFFTFRQDYSTLRAIWYSIFHSIAAFNNGGFDVLGLGDSVGCYTYDVWFNLVTCGLIFFGGLGFFVIRELLFHKKGERYTLHTKAVLTMTFTLIFGGMFLLKLAERENISWLGAFFTSVTARTAGFATFQIVNFSNASIIILCVLMFIGASPGSTGGGVKTTTAFAFVKSLISNSTGREARSFGKKLKDETLFKAFLIISLAFCWVLSQTFLMSLFDPDIPLRDLFFEQVSGFTTTGLSTGITSTLSIPSRIVLIISMYVGRLGPLTIATLWKIERKTDGVSRPEEDLPIG